MRQASHITCLVLALLPLLPGCGLTGSEEKARDLYSNQAKWWRGQGNHRSALQQALKGLEIDPTNYGLNRLMGWCYLNLGGRKNLARAIPYFEECDSQNFFSGDWKLDLGMGIVNHRLAKEHQLAIDYHEQAEKDARLGDDDPIAVAKAMASAKKHSAKMNARYALAIEYLEEVLEADPGNVDALDNLQQIHGNLGRWDREHYQKALGYSDLMLRLAQNTRIQLEATLWWPSSTRIMSK